MNATAYYLFYLLFIQCKESYYSIYVYVVIRTRSRVMYYMYNIGKTNILRLYYGEEMEPLKTSSTKENYHLHFISKQIVRRQIINLTACKIDLMLLKILAATTVNESF